MLLKILVEPLITDQIPFKDVSTGDVILLPVRWPVSEADE